MIGFNFFKWDLVKTVLDERIYLWVLKNILALGQADNSKFVTVSKLCL